MDEYKNKSLKKENGERTEICPTGERGELVPSYRREDEKVAPRAKNRALWLVLPALLAFAALCILLCFLLFDEESPNEPLLQSFAEEEYFGAFESEEIVSRCMESCVSLRSGAPDELGGESVSGVILSSDGWILSGEPIFKNGRGRIYARLYDGEDYAVEEVRYDALGEMTLYKISADGLSAARLDREGKVTQGEAIVAFCSCGAPDYACALLYGVVAHTEREVRIEKEGGILREEGLIQADLALGEGSCGSPAFDREGNLVGISARQCENYFYGIEKILKFTAIIK